MANLNKAMLIGRVCADPEVRYTPSGAAVCQLSVATNRTWKDKTTGDKMEEAEFHRVVFYDRLAEIVGEYVKKGASIYVEGRLKTRKWQNKDGKDQYTTEIIASELQMLSGKDVTESRPEKAQPAKTKPAEKGDFYEDDIPF